MKITDEMVDRAMLALVVKQTGGVVMRPTWQSMKAAIEASAPLIAEEVKKLIAQDIKTEAEEWSAGDTDDWKLVGAVLVSTAMRIRALDLTEDKP